MVLQNDITDYSNNTSEGSLKNSVLMNLGINTSQYEVPYVVEAYVAAITETLNLRPWEFAIRIEPLVAYSDDVGGYYIPLDKIKILAVGHEGCNCSFIPEDYQQLVKVDKYGKHTNRLFTCGCATHIKYTCTNTTLETWNPLARRLLKVILLRNLHMKVHGDIHLNVLQKSYNIINAALSTAADNEDVRVSHISRQNKCRVWNGISKW